MKKRLITLLIVLVIVILVAFEIFILINKNILNKSNEITMIIKEGTLTRTSATVIVEDSNKEHFYGENYSIEKSEDGGWKSLKQIGVYIFNMISVRSITGKLNFNLDWSERYGELENGKYRIVKSVHTPEGEKTVYAEFTIE